MEPPLIVLDTRGELSVFPTAQRVANHLEAIDVLEGEFRLFDSSGVEYELTAASFSDPVRVGGPIRAEPDFGLVRRIVTDYLRRLPASKKGEPQKIELQTAEDIRHALAPFVL